MQTLGLGPVDHSEGRLKSLLWPSVTSDADVDYLTTQGFWICFIVAALTVLSSLLSGSYATILDGVFFYLGGNGVRRRDLIAACGVTVVYLLGTLVIARFSYAAGGTSQIVRFIISALLLANVRAIWIASRWRKSGEADESPALLEETFADKLSDVLPRILWPKVRILFYVFAVIEICALLFINFVRVG